MQENTDNMPVAEAEAGESKEKMLWIDKRKFPAVYEMFVRFFQERAAPVPKYIGAHPSWGDVLIEAQDYLSQQAPDATPEKYVVLGAVNDVYDAFKRGVLDSPHDDFVSTNVATALRKGGAVVEDRPAEDESAVEGARGDANILLTFLVFNASYSEADNEAVVETEVERAYVDGLDPETSYVVRHERIEAEGKPFDAAFAEAERVASEIGRSTAYLRFVAAVRSDTCVMLMRAAVSALAARGAKEYGESTGEGGEWLHNMVEWEVGALADGVLSVGDDVYTQASKIERLTIENEKLKAENAELKARRAVVHGAAGSIDDLPNVDELNSTGFKTMTEADEEKAALKQRINALETALDEKKIAHAGTKDDKAALRFEYDNYKATVKNDAEALAAEYEAIEAEHKAIEAELKTERAAHSATSVALDEAKAKAARADELEAELVVLASETDEERIKALVEKITVRYGPKADDGQEALQV